MPILGLCAGFGGLEIAVEELTGERVAYMAEIDRYAAQILAHHHPDIPNLGDITTIDWTELIGLVDVICAGFPCTDISNAGHRKGIDGEKSRVWYNVAEAIRVLRPRLVFLENVSAIARRGLDRVLGDLAAIGYDARWMCFRASEVGAAHHRDRWFCVAFPSADAPGAGLEGGDGQPAREDEPAAERGGSSPSSRAPASPDASDADGIEPQRRRVLGLVGGTPAEEPGQEDQRQRSGDAVGDCGEAPADPEGQRWSEGGAEPTGQRGKLHALAGGRSASAADTYRWGQQEHGKPQAGRDTLREPSPPHAHGCCTPPPPDAHSVRRQGRRGTRPQLDWGDEPAHPRHSPSEWWGEYAPAIHRWESIIGVPAPYPTEVGPRGGRRLTAVFAEWLMGIPGRVTFVPGISRSQQLHKVGNGVVPHQAYTAYRLILLELLLTERLQLAA
ncbi:DNA cytosine methyltransferase [Streptomyces sp. NPDC006265]|uniref:DNA cytosine methyltransferase n=1 Tax=Streptomyces sp. NPDC006265 TaxID=3156740 RepID=UPI0033B8041F